MYKKYVNSNKRKHNSITEELDKTEKELDELLSDLNVNSKIMIPKIMILKKMIRKKKLKFKDSLNAHVEVVHQISTKDIWFNIFTMTLSLLF